MENVFRLENLSENLHYLGFQRTIQQRSVAYRSLLEGQCNSERRTDANFTLHNYFALMQVHAPFDDRKSKASTGNIADIARSSKRVKEFLQVLGRNAHTSILNAQDS